MIKNKSELLFNIFLIFVMVCIAIAFGMLIKQNYDSEQNAERIFYADNFDDLVDKCSTGNFSQDMICINDFMYGLDYNITDDSITLTFEDMVSRGGDCRDFAFLYRDLGDALGYRATTKKLIVTDRISHRIAIIESEQGYAVMNIHRMFLVKYNFGDDEK